MAAVELDAVKSMSRAGKAALEKDAADLLEIQRQARGRLLGDWSDRKPAVKRAEVAAEPKLARRPLSPYGDLASGKLLAAAQERARVKRYGWQTTLARLAGVSVSVLKSVRLGLPVSAKVCEKVVAVSMATLEAEVELVVAGRRSA